MLTLFNDASYLFTSQGRIATAVLYCELPPRGGATTFTNANVFVKPEVGMTTFFSYRGKDNVMDTGYTTHSGCPVLEGEKWITTLWMREGQQLFSATYSTILLSAFLAYVSI